MKKLFSFIFFTLILTLAPTTVHAATFNPDLNDDKKINIFDYNMLVANFGK